MFTRNKNNKLQGCKSAFTLIELLVVIVIIGILATLLTITFTSARAKARDVKRKADLNMIGKFLTNACYMPTAGVGTYDFSDLITEMQASNEKYRQAKVTNFFDPKSGSLSQSNYFYIVDANNKCAVFANLENTSEPIDLPSISSPTPGLGSGVLLHSDAGPNGTKLYYQVSN